MLAEKENDEEDGEKNGNVLANDAHENLAASDVKDARNVEERNEKRSVKNLVSAAAAAAASVSVRRKNAPLLAVAQRQDAQSALRELVQVRVQVQVHHAHLAVAAKQLKKVTDLKPSARKKQPPSTGLTKKRSMTKAQHVAVVKRKKRTTTQKRKRKRLKKI